MKLANTIFLLGLVTSLMVTSVRAKETSSIDSSLAQNYLVHWFSYDSKEPTNLRLELLADDSFGERRELGFTSDDGQVVNGLIGFPKDKASSKKLALVLHPMGLDQHFWWSDKSPLAANKMTLRLREQGYTVISLDARHHGQRGRDGFGPRELIGRAHSDQPRIYIDTIIGSVRDYRIALEWAQNEFKPEEVLVMGYSMGAQMSLLLASYEPSINTVVAMVPPFVASATSPVAPRIHAPRIKDAKVLWLAGTSDRHSSSEQTQLSFDQIASADKTLMWFDAGHRLPPESLEAVLSFFDSLKVNSSNLGSEQ